MSEENTGYNKLQFSGDVGNGDLYCVRVDSVKEADEIFEELANSGESLIKNLSTFKQVAIAKGAFVKPQAKERKADNAPPGGDGVPTCKHGVMNDAGDPAETGYKSRFYCPLKTSNYKEKCRPRDN